MKEKKLLDELLKFIEEISNGYIINKDSDSIEKNEEVLSSYYKKLKEIYFNNDFRHLYSKLYEKLSYLDLLEKEKNILEKTESPMTFINQNINFIYEYAESEKRNRLKKCKTEKEKKKERDFFYKIQKLYDHLSLDTSRINHMRLIDEKTEENKRDLLNRLESKDKELEGIKNASEKELVNLKKEINEIDKDSLIKTTGFIAMFTLIAGNISIIFKSLDVQPIQLIAVIFIINAMITLSFQLIFYLIDKTRRSRTVITISLLGLVVGVILPICSSEESLNRKIDKKITEKIEKGEIKINETQIKNLKLELENELYKEKLNHQK